MMTTTSKATAENVIALLKKARELIATVGWVQGMFGAKKMSRNEIDRFARHEEYNCFCTLGAMHKANIDLGFTDQWLDSTPVFIRAQLEFEAELNPDYDIADWNDAPSRRKAHVLKKFDRVIAKLERLAA